jgi:hypothetical protein
MRRAFASLGVGIYLLAAACGTSATDTPAPSPGSDGGPPGVGTSDDGGPPPSGDASAPRDGAVPGDAAAAGDGGPSLLTKGVLVGVTSDDYAVLQTPGVSVSVVPLAGGAPTTIFSGKGGLFGVTIRGAVVAVSYSGTGAPPPIGLAVWSAAAGVKTIATGAVSGAVISPGGKTIAFGAGYDLNTGKASVTLANIDGSSPQLVQAGFDVGYCALGDFAGEVFVTVSCDTGSSYALTSYALAGSTLTKTPLDTGVDRDLTIGPDHVVYAKGDKLYVSPVGTAAPVVLDSASSSQSVARFLPGGTALVYSNHNTALRRTPVASPAPTTLVSANVGDLWALSPDGKTAMMTETATGLTISFAIASTTAPGSPISLPNTVTRGSGAAGDLFTDDGNFALYEADYEPPVDGAISGPLGTLEAMSVAGGSPRKFGAHGNTVRAAGGSRVVFDMGRTDMGADLAVIDLAKAGSLPVVLAHAVGRFMATHAKDRVVYEAGPGPLPAVYVAPLP